MNNKKLKILFISHVYPRFFGDSMGCHVHRLSESFVKAGNQVFVLAPHSKNLKRNQQMHGVDIKRYKYFYESGQDLCYSHSFKKKISSFLGMIKLFFLILSCTKEIYKLLDEKKIDVIHAHWSFPSGIIVFLFSYFRKIKWFVSFHGADLRLLDNGLLRALTKKIISRCNGVTTVSSNAMPHYFSKIQNNSCSIPMPIEDEFFFNPKKKKIKSNIFTFLTVASLTPTKKINDSIKAFKLIKDHNPNIKMQIIGDGPEKEKLYSLVKTLNLQDSISFLKHVPSKKIVEVYDSADAFLLVSEGEGLGVSVAEALSRNIPVILTNDAGLKDYKSYNPYYVELNNIENLAKKMDEVINRGSVNINLNIANTIKSKFSGAEVTKNFLDFYTK